jgi:hypothetical protein
LVVLKNLESFAAPAMRLAIAAIVGIAMVSISWGFLTALLARLLEALERGE